METKKLIESIVAKKFKDLTEEETYIYDKAIWKQEHVTNFGNYENQIEYIKGIKKGTNTYDLNLLGNVHHNLVLVANGSIKNYL